MSHQTEVFTAVGTDTFTSKKAVKQVTVACWGGGGGDSGTNGFPNDASGGGGGGGGYGQKTLSVTQSTAYNVVVGNR